MNDLEKVGPNLAKAGKANPFKVPEGYFDSLPSRVQEFCTEQSINGRDIKWAFHFKTQLAIAASLSFIVLLTSLGLYYSHHTNNYGTFEKVDYIKIVEESGTEFDEYELYEAFSNSRKKDSIKNSSNDELIDYLLNSNSENGTHINHSKDIKPWHKIEYSYSFYP